MRVTTNIAVMCVITGLSFVALNSYTGINEEMYTKSICERKFKKI